MKKLIVTLLLAAALVSSMTGCQTNPGDTPETKAETKAETTPETEPETAPADDYIPGKTEGYTYTNSVLGLKFELDDSFVYSTEDEIYAMMQIGADLMYKDEVTGQTMIDYAKISTVYEMMAVNITNNSSILVMAEKLPLSNMTVEQYITALKTQFANAELEMTIGDTEETEISGVSFAKLPMVQTFGSAAVIQDMYLKKIRGRVYIIQISAAQQETIDSILSCITAYQA